MTLLSISAKNSEVMGSGTTRSIAIPRTSGVIAFTDRPRRQAEQYSIDRLIRNWNRFGFKSVPPNAALAIDTGNGAAQWIVVLGKPRVHGDDAIFPIMQIRVMKQNGINAAQPKLTNGRFGSTHVFIDPTDGATATPYTPSAEAQRVFDSSIANPTSIGITASLNGAAPTGKRIISLTIGGDAARALDASTAEAGRALGWEVTSLQEQPTVSGQRQALSDAIAQAPDGIAVSGMEPSVYGDLYRQAEQAGIVVICSACLEAPYGALKDTHVVGTETLKLWARQIAAFTATHTPTTPNVQMFGLSVYPVLKLFDDTYISALREFAPDAAVTFNELDFKPNQIANIYLANPTTNMLVSDLGDFSLGWPAQLSGAGANPGCAPLIGGLTAGADAIKTLKAGTTNAWTAYSLPVVGYSVIDSFARYWTNTPFATNTLPGQVLLPGTVNGAVFNSQGNYVGVADYAAQFKQLWGVS